MGYTKKPVAIGGSLYLPIDLTMRSVYGIKDDMCAVEFEIIKVIPIEEPKKELE